MTDSPKMVLHLIIAMAIISALTLTGCRAGNPAGTDTAVLEIPYRTDTPFMVHPPVYHIPTISEK